MIVGGGAPPAAARRDDPSNERGAPCCGSTSYSLRSTGRRGVYADLLKTDLDALGAEGWELVGVVNDHAVFKRPKPG